jgi:hypothetical protein
MSVDFRSEYLSKTCPPVILEKARNLHVNIIGELRKRNLLPIGDLTPDQEKILDGVVVNWQVEPQSNNKGWTGRINVRAGGSILNEPKDHEHDSVQLVERLICCRESVLDNEKRTAEAQAEWDRREVLLEELRTEYPELILGNNTLGIHICPIGNTFLPLGKEREALELAKKHRKEWCDFVGCFPQQRSLMGLKIKTERGNNGVL